MKNNKKAGFSNLDPALYQINKAKARMDVIIKMHYDVPVLIGDPEKKTLRDATPKERSFLFKKELSPAVDLYEKKDYKLGGM